MREIRLSEIEYLGYSFTSRVRPRMTECGYTSDFSFEKTFDFMRLSDGEILSFKVSEKEPLSEVIPYESFSFIQEFLAGEDREFAFEGEFFEELLTASRKVRFT